MTIEDLGARIDAKIDALGATIDAMDRKFEDKIDNLQAAMNERFDQIGDHLIQLENRIACVEGAVANLQRPTSDTPTSRRQRGVTVAQSATV